MIECSNLHLSLSKNIIFTNLNFHVKAGEKVVLSGISGRGKSSLLKIVQGYLLPDLGTVTINNTLLTEKSVNSIRRQIIWIPQNINLPVNSGIELLTLLNILNKRDRVHNYLNQVGLESTILSKDFSKISGGEKQRIVIACCLTIDRDIILMDEPTSSLDEESIKLVSKMINSLSDKTVLSASHNKSWLKSSGRVIVL